MTDNKEEVEMTEDALARRQKLACDAYETQIWEVEDGERKEVDWDDLFDTVETELEIEGLPIFENYAEMETAIENELGLQAARMETLLKLMEKTGARTVGEALKQKALEAGGTRNDD